MANMTWPAIYRYGLTPAPDRLGLVHDFLCTTACGKPREPDLLGDIDLAKQWLDDACSTWNALMPSSLEVPTIDERGMRALREFRENLMTVVLSRDVDTTSQLPLDSQSLDIQLGHDGTVRLVPYGNDWRAMHARLLVEIYTAQVSGTWSRLKVCRNDRCRGAFFDRSKNNSGVWHDVRTCGNVANLRASRARRRAREQTGSVARRP
jgi:predicted RNA-binding Zn ribbon-like protein